MKLRIIRMMSAMLLMGGAACSFLRTTEGRTGPLAVTKHTFDYHITVKLPSGEERELYYESYQDIDADSIVDMKYRCRHGGDIWGKSGVNWCEILDIKVIRETPAKIKKAAEDAATADATAKLAAAGYYEIWVGADGDPNKNMAFAKAKQRNGCLIEWRARKVGDEYSSSGLICDGEIFKTSRY